MPASTASSFDFESFPTRSDKSCRSSATICDGFATESWGRPVSRTESKIFPGARAHPVLPVRGTQTAVANAVRFKRVSLHDDNRAAEPWTGPHGLTRDRPSRCHLAKSPFDALQNQARRASRELVGRLPEFTEGPIPSFGDFFR